ncbi:uncharacterized protein LOC144107129 [Amblyomma americanum]
MAPTETADHFAVTLSGFGEFLDWRTVQFVGRCPNRNVCTACGVLSNRVWVTLCSHVFCPSCRLRIETFDCNCPADGKTITFENAALLELSESDLDGYKVRCINAGRGCKFEGLLASLKQHFLLRCGYNKASCRRCGRNVARWQAVEHSAACRVGLVPEAILALKARCRERMDDGLFKRPTTPGVRSKSDQANGKLRRSAPAVNPDDFPFPTIPTKRRCVIYRVCSGMSSPMTSSP